MARELFSEAYYLNPYLEEMRAEIEAVFPYEEGVSAVICKDTCFYPEGGGQPGDRGPGRPTCDGRTPGNRAGPRRVSPASGDH